MKLQPEKETPNKLEPKEKEIEFGGSVLADKHMGTLDALLKAYEVRLNLTEQRWRRYLDLENEMRQLEIY